MKWDGFFVDATLTLGREYYEQGVVQNISVNGNKAGADLLFKTKTQRVDIVISKNKFQSITCSCGKENCSHLAAFLMALDQTNPDFLPDFAEPYFLICVKNDSFKGQYKELCKYSGSDETVVVPDGVARLGHCLFSNHEEIKKIVLPETVETISHHVFSNCTGLEEINLSGEVVEIGGSAFDNCYALADKSGLIVVNGHLFRNDRNRTGNLHIPEGVVSIGESAFQDNEFDTITIPSTVSDIGSHAFAQSVRVKEIIVPESVKRMGYGTFENSISLETAVLPGGLKNMCDTFSGCTSLRKVIIPETVQRISQAFTACSALTEIEIPKSVEDIQGGFANCTNLEKITIKGSKIEIDDSAFDGCEKLQIICGKSVEKKIPAKYKPLLPAKKTTSKGETTMNFNIYENMAELDIDKLAEIAKSKDWPKGKRYTVNCGDIEFKLQTYLGKGAEPEYGYDAYSAIKTIYIRQLTEDEIYWEHEDPQFADPEFDKSALEYLSNEEIERRMTFIKAIGNLINDQATMEAIAAAAEKKKNGTFYRNRVLKIASSGIADGWRSVYAIVARAKTDTSLSITFESQFCSEPEDNKKWANDFISTVHEGLPITEALKATGAK